MMKNVLAAIALAFTVSHAEASGPANVAGIWQGFASPVLPSSQGHDTNIVMACDGLTGSATYDYGRGVVCESKLRLISQTGAVRLYKDTTHTRGCQDGFVRLTTHYDCSNQYIGCVVTSTLGFEWLVNENTPDTAGELSQIACLSACGCPKY